MDGMGRDISQSFGKRQALVLERIWAFLIRKSDRNSTAPYGKGEIDLRDLPVWAGAPRAGTPSGTPAAFVRRKSLGNRFYGRTAGLPAASDLFRELPPAGPMSAPRNIRDTDESLVRSDGTLRNVIDRAQFSAFAETTGANTSRARVAGERLFQNKEKSVLIFPAQRGSAELSDDPVTSCKNQRD